MDFLRESDSFTYHLYNEDLPLDKLVELCNAEKVPIRDIFVSDIVEKYVEYVQTLEKMNYESAYEFMVLAATLVRIKSQKMLPTIFPVDEEEMEETRREEDVIIARAQLLNRFKELSKKMEGIQLLNRFYRAPEFDEKDYKIVIKSFSLDRLIDAFKRLLERVEYSTDDREPKMIVRERFTVADRIRDIVEELRAYHIVKFFSLFEEDFSRLEIINTFLAVLEILKEQIAQAEQEETFGDILLRYAPDTDRYGIEEEEGLLKDVEEYR